MFGLRHLASIAIDESKYRENGGFFVMQDTRGNDRDKDVGKLTGRVALCFYMFGVS